MTLVEIALAAALVTFALVGVASAFGSNTQSVGKARELTQATHFLEEVIDSVSAQPFDNLTALNGNVLYDQTTPQNARFRVTITVSQSAVDLLQLRYVLSDHRTGNPITRLATYRSRR